MNVSFYFPGWVRKAITFTIDDGNVPLDKKFIVITKAAGMTGTFNLCTPLRWLKTEEEYREFYQGYEIANHCRYHAYPIMDDRPFEIRDELFDPEKADPKYGYKTEEEGLYRVYTYAWTYMADDDKYMECVDSCQKELEHIFGEGKIRSYIWPCGEQKNARVLQRLIDYGFMSIRAAAPVKDRYQFNLAPDRYHWSYTANWTCMRELAVQFDEYPDDGNLKWMCFGVHSHDFENNHCWDVLEDFCARLGNRPQDFWYANVGEIFDYEDAVKAVRIGDTTIENPSELTVSAVVDGEKITLAPHTVWTK